MPNVAFPSRVFTKLLAAEALRAFTLNTLFDRQRPVVRCRRRGFGRTVRRGSIVRHRGQRYEVLKRSAYSLWLQIPMEPIGSTISVRLPHRWKEKS